MYKLSLLQVNKSVFSIATPVRFAYLAVSTDTVSLVIQAADRIVGLQDLGYSNGWCLRSSEINTFVLKNQISQNRLYK
ncbi:hypothetical protein Enr17x_61080 [Gimesia fumaroli]|uniref:Uncharacterized protein n=1 Tax=Gimesia fumaroli TaxID=2527976 RepID=A0A518ILU2_9PLAN|nr:hypothetical protein Enr17x_61080 [Gimesia fumaroli]